MPSERREFPQLSAAMGRHWTGVVGVLSALALPIVLVRWSSGPTYDRIFMLGSAAAFAAALTLAALAAGGIVRRREIVMRAAVALVVTGAFVGLLPLTCGA